jgi:hypothetical protein
MEWIKDKRYTNLYYISKQFNGFTYNAVMTLEESDKSVKYWFSISSGKKRKDFEIFEEKGSKSFGGIKSLFWLKECLLDFPNFFARRLYGRNQYICIGWSDNRRRNIYERLVKEGFQFMVEGGRKILIKKL